MRHLLKAAFILPLLAAAVFAEGISDYVTAELSVSRDTVYAGEPFEIFLTIRSHSVTLGQDFGLDGLENDSIRRLSQNFSNYPVKKRVKDNRIEETRKFSWKAIGTTTGTVELATVVDISILTRNTKLFFSRPKKTYFKIPARTATLSILPLPITGRPDNFSGAVGSFSLSVEIRPEEAAPGDVVSLRTEVRGTGLLDNVTSPLLTGSSGLKVYNPKLISKAPTLIYEQQIIPLTKEALNLPSISFSFFDPGMKIYRTIRKGPFQIRPRAKSVAAETTFKPQDSLGERPGAALPGTPVSFRNASIGLTVVILLLVVTFLRKGEMSKHSTATLATLLAAALLAGFTYLVVLQSGYFQRNVYRVESRQKGMSAPSPSSLQTSIIPSGSHVEQLACEAGWVLISHYGRQCWVRESALSQP